MGEMKAWVLTSSSASSCSSPPPIAAVVGGLASLTPAFQPSPSQRRRDLPTSVKGESGEFLNLSLRPSCQERDSINYSQRMGRVLQGATLFPTSRAPPFPFHRSRADGGQRQPRVFIGNSLELRAIVFVVLPFFYYYS